MSEEWVSGDKVDFEGFAECREIGTVIPVIIGRGSDGRYTFGRGNSGSWDYCYSKWSIERCFRRVVTPDPEVIKAGERWMKIVAKLNKHGGLFELFPQERASLTLARNTILSVVKRDKLDAYLAEPQPKRFLWEGVAGKPSIELLPGASESVEVDGFRVTVERIE